MELDGFLGLVKFEHIVKQIDKLQSIEFDIEDFENYYEGSDVLEKIFRLSYKKSLTKQRIQKTEGVREARSCQGMR